MGTRGTYGFRKNGEDKLTYNHYDSYPDGLGRTVVEFCKNHTIEELNDTFDKITLVDERTTPTEKQIDTCIKNGLADFSVSSQQKTDWYCLLRNCQGDLESLFVMEDEAYMIDNCEFIKDSLWCEYGYIINLDDNVLEYYKGFQKKPQINNRYGVKANESGYYPCKLILEIPLNQINDMDRILKMMEYGEKYDDIIETIELNSDYDLDPDEAEELGCKKIVAIWDNIDEAAEYEARYYNYLTDDNERYFDIELYGQDMLNENYMEFESTGRVVCYES